MSFSIPRQPIYTIEKGARGVPAWAVQRGLNAAGVTPRLVEDDTYGKLTKRGVATFQGWHDGMLADGKFGPITSHALAVHLQDQISVSIPDLLLEGQIEGESGGLIAATNWNVAGGVDCGYTQRRVYDENYGDEAVVKRAFDSAYQINLLARTLRDRRDSYVSKGIGNERAWRLAVAFHNYPYGVVALVDGRWPNAYSTAPQAWVTAHGLSFPDGYPVRTPIEWLERYSLGNPAHREPGQMVRFVESWIA